MNSVTKTTLAIGAVLVSGLALAGPMMNRGGCGPHGADEAIQGVMSEHMMEHMSQKLALTDAQRTAIDTIVDETRARMGELRDALREGRQDLRLTVFGDNPSDAELRALAAQQGDYVENMIMVGAQTKSDIFNVLDESQRETLEQWLKKRSGGSRHHF